MTELVTSMAVDAPTWNESVRHCGGTIFHSAEWARFVQADQPNAVAEYYTLYGDDGAVAGVALGFSTRSVRKLASAFTRNRWFDAAPALRDGSGLTLADFVAAIERRSRGAGDVTLRMGSFASANTETTLTELEFSIARRIEFELNLVSGEKALWDAMGCKRRNTIRKAMRSAVVIRELPAEEGLGHLRRLQGASFVRIANRGGPRLMHRHEPGRDPVEVLIDAGAARIVAAFVNDECVSANVFTTFNRLAYLMLAGHDAKALETQAPTLVLWEMTQRFRADGFTRLNLGGCGIDAMQETSPDHGVYAYKKGFGGTRLDCASGEKTLRPAVHRVANLVRAMAR